MNRQRLSVYAYLTPGVAVLGVLIALTLASPPAISQLLPTFLFCGLIAFTDIFGVRLPAGAVSLLPMTTVAAYLVTGLVPSGWAAFVGTLVYGAVRAYWSEALGFPPPTQFIRFLSLLAINATMHAGSILVGGAVFQALGGDVPLAAITADNLPPLMALSLSFLAFNYLVAGVVITLRSRSDLKGYVQSLPHLLFYEGAPLIFAPTVALIYTRIGIVQFILFSALIVVTSLITRSLSLTSRRLERRVQELGSLQAIGHVLSSSLNVDTILAAIHTQVALLMPARNFYVALYDPETSEVSFPLAFEDGQRVTWRSRQAGSGLTEYILQTRQPLLIRRDVAATLERIGINQIGKPAAAWLGVPILADQEPIGIIAIQSYTIPGAYDTSHQEVLVTIAAQAALAIQNARLYERTDEALARRVQELASILYTASEGILLLDTDYRILAANRALADFLGMAQAEMAHQHLGADNAEAALPLLTAIGVGSLQTLDQVCRDAAENDVQHKQIIVVPGSPERHLERTLTPVRDRNGLTTGWLFVFRDISEEIELARLREDMMHMLVHDLRSPLAVLQGSLDMMEIAIKEGKFDDVAFMEQLARRGSERMLRLVNELLDISKLESGEVPIRPEAVDPESLLREIATRLSPLAQKEGVTLDMRTPSGLPHLYVDVKFIERALQNLVDNAIKFTSDAGTVELWADTDPQNDRALLLGVADTGPGIPPHELPRLFEKFQQTSVSGRRVGTGLGLPFCKLAVEAHGGRIWVESEVGKGTTFIMQLPTVDTTCIA
ncbi:MAG: GAF domain-containing protein [Anaerolineae bacterium]|nr:GAF domain-containing protein [Anaerolineae bacterium]